MLKYYSSIESMEVDNEILEARSKGVEKRNINVPYNILPLDADSTNQEIMRLPEIQAAVVALRNTRGLPSPKNHQKKANEDIFDWLQEMFGFQKDNVANQREHLILLLANGHMRKCPELEQQAELDDRAVTEVMNKLFKNYKKWCKHLDRKRCLWLPTIQQEVQQRKLLYIALYLLIWGEAANLRFMPECLCYIYHHMAFELYGMLDGNVSPMTGEKVMPVYGGEDGAFLRKVVTPIYEVIAREAERSKRGTMKNSQWRNYDDLNEYFWSPDCFLLGWPMRADADFFVTPISIRNGFLINDNESSVGESLYFPKDRWVGKVNFVEIRSFWHIFRSFDRMWNFFILSLQVMIIVAWNDSTIPSAMFKWEVFKKLLTVFITAPILKLGQALLDVTLNWKARWRMPSHVKLRYNLKILVAAIWVTVFPVTYFKSLLWFTVAVSIYLSPNVVATVLFLFPCIRQQLERSNNKIIMVMIWWSQPQLYVGREMHENTSSLIKYTLFWALVIVTKLAFSYYIEIKPLVGPTKDIMSVRITNIQWPEFYPRAWNKLGVVIALWAPIIFVYFIDMQMWYTVFSTIFGCIYGAFRHLGLIRTLAMVRSHFESLHLAFNARLIPQERSELKNENKASKSSWSPKIPSNRQKKAAIFAQLWNKIIESFRQEDLISNSEMDLLLVPYWADRDLDFIKWPPFLLAGKIQSALLMVDRSDEEEHELKDILEEDHYMSYAIRECYASFKNIIMFLIQGEYERKVIHFIFSEVDKHIHSGDLFSENNMSALPKLYEHLLMLTKYLLVNDKDDTRKVTILFQDMFEVVSRSIMTEDNKSRLFDEICDGYVPCTHLLFEPTGAIRFPVSPITEAWKEKIKRLHILLTTKGTHAMNIPSNLEARRRILFFLNSLFMDMPLAPKVHNMLSFSALTPYVSEDVLFSLDDLKIESEDGVSTLSYLEKIHPDEWTNFIERMQCDSGEDIIKNVSDELREELRLWASYRGQTLSRTVRGMMYTREALELQAFLDMAKDEELLDGYKAVELNRNDDRNETSSLLRQCQAVTDIKFSYVVSCEQYGIHKQSGDARAKDILRLMTKYPSLRVAYIDQVEELSRYRTPKKVYYSMLVKVVPKSIDSSESVENLDQVIYRIKLPGPPILGEGKAENQNHAIIFTRGECLQTIDMNQDNYMEEALKMRNLLQEFLEKQDGLRLPTILGFREHIFTGSVSSLTRFVCNQEASFVTICQRMLANPLKVRFHYGHPDVLDRLFHLTRGGISKASKVINLSGDIFAGFNSTLREGSITHHEYIQVGKGREVSFNQISMFEAKKANGNGEQTMARDMYRLGHRFDFFRMLSCYFTTIGLYFCALMTVVTMYVFLYGRLYLVLSGCDEYLSTQSTFKVAFASQSFVQMMFLMVFPMLIEIGLEKGFTTLCSEFVIMLLQLGPVFFAFSIGTKAHYYGRTLLHGGAKYRPSDRSLVVLHAKFVENYRLYSRSHFVKAIEMMILLVVYHVFSQSNREAVVHIFLPIYIWFVVGSWLLAPFLFNPSSFQWKKVVYDWTLWSKWMNNEDGIFASPESSWESWWKKEHEHLRHSRMRGLIAEILLALRFFFYQYGLVYHLTITKSTKSIWVYGLSWLVFFLILLGTKIINMHYRSIARILKAFLILAALTPVVTLSILFHFSPIDVILSILSFMPTGWGILLIAQALKPVVVRVGLWGLVRSLARWYEYMMGLVVFVPVLLLSWFPFISQYQTRMLL